MAAPSIAYELGLGMNTIALPLLLADRRSTFFQDGWNICDILAAPSVRDQFHMLHPPRSTWQLVLAAAIDCFVLSLLGIGGQVGAFAVAA